VRAMQAWLSNAHKRAMIKRMDIFLTRPAEGSV
jgi:hypothetical protein